MRKTDLARILAGQAGAPAVRRGQDLQPNGPSRSTRFQDTVRRAANAPRRRAY